MLNLLLDFTSAVFHVGARSVESTAFYDNSMFSKVVIRAKEKHSWRLPHNALQTLNAHHHVCLNTLNF